MRTARPVIGLNDSGRSAHPGGEYVASLEAMGLVSAHTAGSGVIVIPQSAQSWARCAGGAVYSPAITDFVR